MDFRHWEPFQRAIFWRIPSGGFTCFFYLVGDSFDNPECNYVNLQMEKGVMEDIFLKHVPNSSAYGRMATELLKLSWVQSTQLPHHRMTYFLDYHLFSPPTTQYCAAYLTHYEPEIVMAKRRWFQAIEYCDVLVCQNVRTYDLAIAIWEKHFSEYQDREQKFFPVIHTGATLQHLPVVFGVVGDCYASGRKGEDFVAMAIADGYDFLAYGSGWPCKTFAVDFDEATLEAFYSKIDYLVITSSSEGGPMPVLDAIARKIPIIAPDVGFCWEYPVIRYHREYFDLKDTLFRLTYPYNWDIFRLTHEAHFMKFLDYMDKLNAR